MATEKKWKILKSEPRLDPAMRVLKAIHSAGTPEELNPEDLKKQRRNQEILGNLTAPMAGMEWNSFEIQGIPAAWMRLQRPHKHKHAILYCHGGGYTSGNLGYSKVLASKLTQCTGYDVLAFEYRLAPEHPYPAALDDGEAVWNHLMYLGYGAQDIVIAGDSAGGNMALALCHRLKASGRMLPGAMLLMSPWTDMTLSGKSYQERAEFDPMLTNEYLQAVGTAYANGEDLKNPLLSPLFGNFQDFPPTLIQAGTHEILYSDAKRLADKMVAAGVPCRMETWEDMWHVFQMFPLKKSALAIQSMAHFLLEQL